MSLLIIILFSQVLHAAVLKHDISSPIYKEFEYTEVCTTMGAKQAILTSPKSLSEMECLNKTYLIKMLTQKRGIKKVVCEMSESVMVSVSCDKRDLKYCFAPQKGCEELRKIYAHRLETAHFSMLEKNLNCYFSKTLGESLNEI